MSKSIRLQSLRGSKENAFRHGSRLYIRQQRSANEHVWAGWWDFTRVEKRKWRVKMYIYPESQTAEILNQVFKFA